MKKFGLIFMAFVAMLGFTGCSNKQKFYVLNWGEYISDDVIDAFEQEYDVKVVYSEVDSNEAMYKKITGKSAAYDIVFPSDYMVEKLKNENLLNEIDYTKLTNFEAGIFVPELQALMDSDTCKSYKNYYIPYFWGSLGLMYNTEVTGLKEAIETNGYKVLFEHNLLPANTSVGMYDSSRDSFAAALMYLGYSINTTSNTELTEAAKLLGDTKFDNWGTDDIKTLIAGGNLDVALAYSGDFFDAFYMYDENEQDINFDMYCPTDVNNVFFDAMVIPTTSKNVDLAHSFIDFILKEENSYLNAEAVGYCPTLKSVYDEIFADEEWDYVTQYAAYDPAKIIDASGSADKVYKDLGNTAFAKMETLYQDLRTK